MIGVGAPCHCFVDAVFDILGFCVYQSEDNESQLLCRLLVPNLLSPGVFIYNREKIACVAGNLVSASSVFLLLFTCTTLANVL